MGNEQSLAAEQQQALQAGVLGLGGPAVVADSGTKKRRASGTTAIDERTRKWTRKPGDRKQVGGGRRPYDVGDASSEEPVPPNEHSADESAGNNARGRNAAKFIEWAPHEDSIIREGYAQHGAKWTLIAKELPGRTDNAVRNRWKRLEEGETWRQNMVGEGVDVSQLPPDQVPGYKCRKCGLPKRGHTCPFNAPPVGSRGRRELGGSAGSADADAEDGDVDVGALLGGGSAGLGGTLQPTPSGRVSLEQLQRMIGDDPSFAARPGEMGTPGMPPAPALQRPPPVATPPAELSRNTSSIERLLTLSRDFSMSFLRSLNGQLAPSPQNRTHPPTPPAFADASAAAAEAEADAIARELQLAAAGGPSSARGALSADTPPPTLQRAGSSIEKLLSVTREFSMSFLTEVLGLSPGKKQRSNLSERRAGGGGAA